MLRRSNNVLHTDRRFPSSGRREIPAAQKLIWRVVATKNRIQIFVQFDLFPFPQYLGIQFIFG